MPLKIVRNDITKMNTEAIVNTANENVMVGPGCDTAVYEAAGYEELLQYRKEHIGYIKQGQVFVTPGFKLPAQYIIHAVSPVYTGDTREAEKKISVCYRHSLRLAKQIGIKSIAFPLISTGGFGCPKEVGIRIAVDQINEFLEENEMDVYLVVFDSKATRLGASIYPDLEEYIDQNYVEKARADEYEMPYGNRMAPDRIAERCERMVELSESLPEASVCAPMKKETGYSKKSIETCRDDLSFIFDEKYRKKLDERMKHMGDTFSQYLMYLIKQKNLKNADVYKDAIVNKRVFSKIKNNIYYHPDRQTALCLCIGAHLNLDESRDLLARAGYALSPSDKTDIIFSYFIENGLYDICELDIQLEEHGLPCIIS